MCILLFILTEDFDYFRRQLVFFLAVPRSMWDLSSLTKDTNQAACSGSAES